MKSYQARLAQAKKGIIAEMIADIIEQFGPALSSHGFTETTNEHNEDWETITVNFRDPVRKDEVFITCSYEHKFSAGYTEPGAKYVTDETDELSFKRFERALVKLVDESGWTCEKCDGEGEVYVNEDLDDEEIIPCPACGGTGKTRKIAA